MRIAPGDRLGQYVVESEIGAGGMGRVFRARDTRLQRPVAIEVLSSELAGPSARHRFEKEAINTSALNHPQLTIPYRRCRTTCLCRFARSSRRRSRRTPPIVTRQCAIS